MIDTRSDDVIMRLEEFNGGHPGRGFDRRLHGGEVENRVMSRRS